MADKITLKDYQKSILDKLEAVKNNIASAQVSYLGVSIGGRAVLVDLLEISETLAMVDIQPIPLVKSWFLGVSNIRGVLYAINDVVGLLDNQPTQISSNTRILLINKSIISNVGFVVDKLIGLRNAESLIALEDSTEESICFSSARFEDEDKKLWMVLDCQKMVSSRVFETPYVTV